MRNYINRFKHKSRKTIAAGLVLMSMASIASAASYMNIDTYRSNEAAFSQSASSSTFIAGKWKDASATINNEIARIQKNMAKPDDTEEQKKGKYKKLNEVIESPLIKSGTIDEKYKDAHGHAYITASGNTSSGSFSEQGFATGNLSKGSKEVIFENRYGNATSGGYTFDYIVFTKKTSNADGSWNAQSHLVIGDSAHPLFQTYYATITTRGSASGEIHEFTRGIAIDVNKNIRNVEQSIVYNVNADNKQLFTMMSNQSLADESSQIDFTINGEDMSYGITTDDNDIQQQCLNDGIDVSQCAIPSFLAEYAKLKKEENAEGIARLTSGIIEKDALANADDSDMNNLFSETTGKMAAAGVVTLGAALGCYSVLRRKPEDEEGSEGSSGAGDKTLSDVILGSGKNPDDCTAEEMFSESDAKKFGLKLPTLKDKVAAIGMAGVIAAGTVAAPFVAESASVATALGSISGSGIPIVSGLASSVQKYLPRATTAAQKSSAPVEVEGKTMIESFGNGGSLPNGIVNLKNGASAAETSATKTASSAEAATTKAAHVAENSTSQTAAQTATDTVSLEEKNRRPIVEELNKGLTDAKQKLANAFTGAERRQAQREINSKQRDIAFYKAKENYSTGDYLDFLRYGYDYVKETIKAAVPQKVVTGLKVAGAGAVGAYFLSD